MDVGPGADVLPLVGVPVVVVRIGDVDAGPTISVPTVDENRTLPSGCGVSV